MVYGSKRSRSRSKERSSNYHKDGGAAREIRMPPNLPPTASTSSTVQKRKDSAGAGSEEGEIKKKSS
jgi:hypothetical protein